MSAQIQNVAPDFVASTSSETLTALESAWQRAWDARHHAAATGDYVAAQRWHDRARSLATQIVIREQDTEQETTAAQRP